MLDGLNNPYFDKVLDQATNLPESNFPEVDVRVAVLAVHQQGVLDVPPGLPEVPGVALLAVLHSKLNIHFVCGPNMFENCI